MEEKTGVTSISPMHQLETRPNYMLRSDRLRRWIMRRSGHEAMMGADIFDWVRTHQPIAGLLGTASVVALICLSGHRHSKATTKRMAEQEASRRP
jgi:hypothetical protein